MDIRITQVCLVAEVTCSHCGESEEVEVNEQDVFFSEEQMEEAVLLYGRIDDWDAEDGLCPGCVYDRDNPEEEED